MSISRRKLITGGVVGAVGMAGAGKLAGQFGLIPPDSGGLYGIGETLTYASQRLLTGSSMAREFSRSEISRAPFANGRPPRDEVFKRHQADGFVDWKLKVDGMVERPATFSLAELRAKPMRSQITHLACEEGWSYIAEWTGVALSDILHEVGAHEKAKFVVYFSIQPSRWESIDMADALHPQTLVTTGMNGGDLPVGFGGPVRMRLPRQLGYKNIKYMNRLTVTDSLKGFGKGLGSSAPEAGYAWYAGI